MAVHPSEASETQPWVWLSQPAIEFGGARPSRDGDERTVWLYADPLRALDLAPSATRHEVREARRRLTRLYHPDAPAHGPDTLSRFYEIQDALDALDGKSELRVEPVDGGWWSFVGFADPARSHAAPNALARLTFEVAGLERVPRRNAEEIVRISYGEQVIQLPIRYSRSQLAAPVLLAKLRAAGESAVLVLLCLTIIPLVATLVALDIYLLSKQNVPATWGVAILIIAAGYGALATALAWVGHQVPFPRRAVFRTRSIVTDVRALGRSRL